jgi:hypothetical protein
MLFLSSGYIIYFTYGIRKSTEGKLMKEEKVVEYKKESSNRQSSAKIEAISDKNAQSRF